MGHVGLLRLAGVFFLFAIIAALTKHNAAAVGAMSISESLFYIFVALAAFSAFFGFQKRRKK